MGLAFVHKSILHTHCTFSTICSIYDLNSINMFGMLNCYFYKLSKETIMTEFIGIMWCFNEFKRVSTRSKSC